MKVIKTHLSVFEEGQKETMEVTCEECNAVLEVESRDVRCGPGGGNFQVKCPCCQQWTRIDWKTMTDSFRNWCYWHNNGTMKPNR